MATGYKGITVPEYTDPSDGPGAFRASVDSGPIPRFANASDRDAAIPSPLAGLMAFMNDSGSYVWYNGSAWDALLGDSAPAQHTHSAAQIVSGVLEQARLPDASTTAQGIVQLNTSVTSTSATLAATSSAVKTAYDAGNHSHPYAPVGPYLLLTGGNLTGPLGVWVGGVELLDVSGLANGGVHVKSTLASGIIPFKIERTGGGTNDIVMRVRSGGAIVDLTWSDFNALKVLANA